VGSAIEDRVERIKEELKSVSVVLETKELDYADSPQMILTWDD
jgi:hypothetical protein